MQNRSIRGPEAETRGGAVATQASEEWKPKYEDRRPKTEEKPDQVVVACKKSEIAKQINKRRESNKNFIYISSRPQRNFQGSAIFEIRILHFYRFYCHCLLFLLLCGFRRLAKLFHNLPLPLPLLLLLLLPQSLPLPPTVFCTFAARCLYLRLPL